jgi:hypothetical protein
MNKFAPFDSRETLLRVLADFYSEYRLTESGQEPLNLYVIGGSALFLRELRSRITVDIDSLVMGKHSERFWQFAHDFGVTHSLPKNWINENAKIFLPPLFDFSVDWDVVFEQENFRVHVAPTDLLLAMKLRSNRGLREEQDIFALSEECGVRDVEEAEDLLKKYYPGDDFAPLALKSLEKWLQSR